MQDYGYDQERAEVRRGVKWGLIALAAVLALVALIWGLNVATSGVRGQGDAVVQRNSAANWTKAQADFEERYAHIEAQDRKIQAHYDRLQADPDSRFAETNYYGARDNCESAVAGYNAKARTFLAGDFRSADLPAQIDSTNPLTDCKEN